MTTWIHRSCPVCEASCGLRVRTDATGTRIARVEGDPEDPRSRGYVCPKSQALVGIQEDPYRLRRPVRKTRGGAWEDIAWDDAYALAVDRLQALRDEHGPLALGAFIGNPTGHDAGASLYTTHFIRALGTPNVFSTAHMDHATKLVSSRVLYGRANILPIPDIDRCDHFLCLGANPLVSNGSLMSAPDMKRRLAAIRARGGKVVVIDPRRSETAQVADEHCFIRPGTDALLLFAMVHVVFDESLVRLGHLEPVVDGVDALRELARPFSPESVAVHCEIEAHDIRRLAREFAGAERACCYGRIGTCTVHHGTLASWLIDVLGILTGHFDREGGMMFPRPATGDLEAGPETPPFTTGRWRTRVRGLPEIDGQFSCAAFAEEMEVEGEGRIRGLITVAANPVLTIPNGPRVASALSKLDFMVAIDIYRNETTRHADLILPTLPQAERENFDLLFTTTAVRNFVRWSPAILPPDAGGRPHWEVLLELAGRLNARTCEEMEREILVSQARRLLARKGMPACGMDVDEALSKLDSAPGPMRLIDLMLRAGPYGDGFDEGREGLSLAAARAVPHAIDLGPLEPRLIEILRSPGRRIDLAHPHLVQDVPRLRERLASKPSHELRLIGRRQIQNMNSHLHNLPALAKGRARCTLAMNSADAEARRIRDGEVVVVRSKVGRVEVAVAIDDAMMPGVVSLPHGYGHLQGDPDLPVAGRLQPGINSNELTDESVVDPLSGSCLANGIAVEVEVR